MMSTTHRGSQVITLLVTCLGLFMVFLDGSIVNVALPTIQADLHAQLSDLQWVVDAYTLPRSEEHTSELQSHSDLVCRLLLEKKKTFVQRSGRHCAGSRHRWARAISL